MPTASLRSHIVMVFVGLLALVMALIIGLVTRSNAHIVAGEMHRELALGKQVFQRLVEQNRHQLEVASTLLAADFAFREAIATLDLPTMRSVSRNHGLRIGARVMMVVSPAGQLIATTQPGQAAARPFPYADLLAAAERNGKSAGFKLLDGQIYQIVMVPIMAPRLIAWVAMGFLVDDAWVGDLAQVTGLEVSVMQHEAEAIGLPASSLPPARRAHLGALLAGGLADEIVVLDGERFQRVVLPLADNFSVLLLRSLQAAEAPFATLQSVLLTVMLGGIALFAFGSFMLARRIVMPLRDLGAAARRIEDGDYGRPVPPPPFREIGQLATSFDHMRARIAAREQFIRRLAYEDGLTGLANRTRFLEAFAQLPAGSRGAVAVLDLDRFALINNALGHPVGDRLIADIGKRLATLGERGMLVARLWGDEFAFLSTTAGQQGADGFATEILACLRQPIALEGQRLDVGGSLGIAFFPADGADATTLLRRAESAMQAAKRQHRSYACVADLGQEPGHEKLSLIGEMRDALAARQFVVYYQPKLDLASGRIVAAEALLRWQHPQRGLVPPLHFIPFAEQTGFIREITPWLIDAVTAQTALWRRAGLAVVPSLNLSALDLVDDALVPRVRDALARHGLAPGDIGLEITESALMEEPERALAHLAELAALGVSLSIDDYGAGQASLAYVKNLPVDELKIDQTFVTAVADTPKNAAIVRSTIVLGHELGLRVVAEGAETAEDLRWLQANGCDLAQGYGIARPMPAADLGDWLAGFATAPARATA